MRTSAMRESAIGVLASTPRVWIFMALTLLSAMATGAQGVARVTIATEAYGNAVGLGTMALTYGLAAVIMCLPSGMIVDRFSARYVFLASLLLLVIAQGRLAILASQGAVLPADLIVNSAIEGILTGLIYTSLAKVQASLVDRDARGSAEVINLLRVAIGALMGTMIAGAIANPALVMGLAAGASALVAIGVVLVSRNSRSSSSGTRSGADLRVAFQAIRARRPLQILVVVDLIFRIVIPTQVITLFIADAKIVDLASTLISLGIVGVLIGQFALAVRGVNRSKPPPYLAAFTAAMIIALVATYALWSGWLLRSDLAVSICILSYGALTAFAQGSVAAMIQQECPDDVRGRLTAGLGGVRNLFVTVAVAVGSLIMAAWHLPGMATVISGLMVLALAVIRGVSWFQRESIA